MAATVLVCDNEAPLRALLRASLEGPGLRVAEARDGEECLALARSLEPDLVVLDLMMPVKSGFEVLAELRRDTRLSATPVVVLSARTHASDRDAVAAAGASAFLSKPFSPRELAATVSALLGGDP